MPLCTIFTKCPAPSVPRWAADKRQTRLSQVQFAPSGIVKIGVTRVYNQVTGVKHWFELFNHGIHGAACFDHDDNRAGFGKCSHQCGRGLARDQVFGQFACLGDKIVNTGRCAVVNSHRKPFFGDIERQICPHYCQSDKPNPCVAHASSFALIINLYSMLPVG